MSLSRNEVVLWLHNVSSLDLWGPPVSETWPRLRGRERDGWRPASVRSFSAPPAASQIQQLLDNAYGWSGVRPVPSAGALYPLRFFVASIGGAPALGSVRRATTLNQEQACALDRAFFNQVAGPSVLIVAQASMDRPVRRYGARAYRYALLEAGHWAQEAIRFAAEVGLRSCPLGAFDDVAVSTILGNASGWTLPLYGLALGEA